MVQIIPRANPTFGEQIVSGLNKGIQQGSELGQLYAQSAIAQKEKLAESQRKMQLAGEFQKKFINQGMDAQVAEILGAEMAGVVTGGSSKSAINAFREQQGKPVLDYLSQILGGNNGSSQSLGTDRESQVDNPLSFGGSQPNAPSQSSSRGTSRIGEIENQIAQLRPLMTMGSADQRKIVADSINSLQNERDFAFRQEESEKKTTNLPKQEYYKHAAKENSEFLTDIGNIERDLPNTSLALAGIKDALGNANKWANIRDNLADKTGFEGARSAAGAELDSFIKSYFLGDLTSIKGGRPNVFIEKQIRDAYPKAGRDPIANQKVAIGMDMKEKLNQLLVDETRKLEKFYLDKDDFLPSGFKAKVKDSIRERAKEIEKKAIDTLHNMSSIEEQRDKIFRKSLKKGEVLMMDQEGTPFAVPKKEVSAYQEMGYIPLGEK